MTSKSTSDSLISRVKEMEERYDALTTVLGELDMAVEAFLDHKGDLAILRDYMASGQWQKDFEADEAGLLPSDLKRGILAEDALFDLLDGADRILASIREKYDLKK